MYWKACALDWQTGFSMLPLGDVQSHFRCSLLENIRLGNPRATDEEVKAAARAAQCEEFIQKLPDGYDTPAGEAGKQLSGGEKQRIAIARMILKNAPVETKANRDMTGAVLEYARGLSVVKSFGQSGTSMQAFSEAVADSRKIHLKIEWGFIPANSLHLLALKCGSMALALAAFFMGLNGKMEFSMMLIFVFYSFGIFASVEPVSDSAHVE